MIRSVHVRDFQSLAKVDLELGGLTVVVGASSSGKSALVRAVQLLSSNRAGSFYVRRGCPHAQVTVKTEDAELTVQRGRESYYQVGGTRYTKVGTGVPDEVTAALGVPPGDQPNFASQFDRPFLLDDSGSRVAQTLGELTNIVLVMKAAKEANRERLAVNQRIKDSAAQLKAFADLIPKFSDLPKTGQLLREAKAALDMAQASENLANRIQECLSKKASLEVFLMQPVKQVPDLGPLEAVAVELRHLEDLLSRRDQLEGKSAEALSEMQELDRRKQDLDDLYKKTLEEAGVCPTCGQTIKETHDPAA
jgi:energy-coupling factor transporter ATP-binding protein EcfA2